MKISNFKKFLLLSIIFLFSLFLFSCGNHTHEYYTKTITKEPTCTSEGTAFLICKCGELYQEEIIPASPHSFNNATCTLPKICRICDATEGKALGHTKQDTPCGGVQCSICKYVFEPDIHEFAFKEETPSTLLTEGIRVDKCTICGVEKSTTLDLVDPVSLGMPIVYLSDYSDEQISIDELYSAAGYVLIKYKYVSNDGSIESFECFSQIKSSDDFSKKNFTIELYDDESLMNKHNVDFGWGSNNKYHINANYIDSSYARNIVSAEIFSEIVATRKNIDEGLLSSPNYGVIDGFPILLYLNDKFHGVYTMNIPKDKWTFAMGESQDNKEALLFSNGWQDSNKLNKPIGDSDTTNWNIDYCSTEDNSWVFESFNKLIELINCGDNERIKAELSSHLDIEAAIDNFIFTYFINAADNTGRNILWATYDGEIWIPSVYNMSASFGTFWNGSPTGDNNSVFPQVSEEGTFSAPQSKLYRVLVECYADELLARYNNLRKNILTIANVEKHFEAFFELIPDAARNSDTEKWSNIPHYEGNLDNIYSSTKKQLARLDAFFNRLHLIKK